jgi:hypothetical protein
MSVAQKQGKKLPKRRRLKLYFGGVLVSSNCTPKKDICPAKNDDDLLPPL